jgi:hypothetical protein
MVTAGSRWTRNLRTLLKAVPNLTGMASFHFG